MRCFWLACLTLGAMSDMRDREVSIRLLAVCGAVGLWAALGDGIEKHIPGMAAGAAILAVSRVTEGKIGIGDGLFFMASAGYLTAPETWLLLLGGLTVSWVWSIAEMTGAIWSGKKLSGKTIPFLVCLWPAGIWITVNYYAPRFAAAP